jgi:hypothetical protein
VTGKAPDEIGPNVDFDRLADYVGGALDGTPDADTVTHLVATDDQWARAYDAMLGADAIVTNQLSGLAAMPEPMPDDVFAKLTAAFAAEPPLTGEKPHLSVLPGGRTTTAATPSRRRWSTVVGVAAAVAVIGVGGVAVLPRLLGGDTRSATSSGAGFGQERPNSAQEPGSTAQSDTAGNPPTLAAPTTALADPKVATPEGGPGIKGVGPSAPPVAPPAVPDQLRRLSEPDGRTACVNAILAEYGGSVALLDYARYQGSPALVVLIDGAYKVPNRKWVVVVGPNCGIGGAIADQKYSAQVG